MSSSEGSGSPGANPVVARTAANLRGEGSRLLELPGRDVDAHRDRLPEGGDPVP